MEYVDKFYSPLEELVKQEPSRKFVLPARPPLLASSPARWQFGGSEYPRELRCVNGPPQDPKDPRLGGDLPNASARLLGSLCHGLATFRHLNDRRDPCALLAHASCVTVTDDIAGSFVALIADDDIKGSALRGLPTIDALLTEILLFCSWAPLDGINEVLLGLLEERRQRRRQKIPVVESGQVAAASTDDDKPQTIFSWARYGTSDGEAPAPSQVDDVPQDAVVSSSEEPAAPDEAIIPSPDPEETVEDVGQQQQDDDGKSGDEVPPSDPVMTPPVHVEDTILLERTAAAIEVLVRSLIFLEAELLSSTGRTIDETIAAVRHLEEAAPWLPKES